MNMAEAKDKTDLSSEIKQLTDKCDTLEDVEVAMKDLLVRKSKTMTVREMVREAIDMGNEIFNKKEGENIFPPIGISYTGTPKKPKDDQKKDGDIS